MNTAQKLITASFLVIFALTLVYFPWLTSPKTGPGGGIFSDTDPPPSAVSISLHDVADAIRDLKPASRVTVYQPILSPPNRYARPDWSIALVYWLPLAVVYAGLMAIARRGH